MHQVKKGKKHTCSACMTKFYDLDKDIAICPRCGTKQSSIKEVPDIIVNTKKTNNEENTSEDAILEEDVNFDDLDKNVDIESNEV